MTEKETNKPAYSERERIAATLSDVQNQVPPDILSAPELSKMEGVDERMLEKGIIFDSFEQLKAAVLDYQKRRRTRSSHYTTGDRINDRGNPGMFDEIQNACKNGKIYRKHFYFDNLGYNWTEDICVYVLGDKWVLELDHGRSYELPEENQPEVHFANALPGWALKRGLKMQSKSYQLAKIEGTDWAGVDVGRIFGDMLSEEDITKLIDHACGRDESWQSLPSVTIDGKKVQLRIYLGQSDNPFRPLSVGHKLYRQHIEGYTEYYPTPYGEHIDFTFFLERNGTLPAIGEEKGWMKGLKERIDVRIREVLGEQSVD